MGRASVALGGRTLTVSQLAALNGCTVAAMRHKITRGGIQAVSCCVSTRSKLYAANAWHNH